MSFQEHLDEIVVSTGLYKWACIISGANAKRVANTPINNLTQAEGMNIIRILKGDININNGVTVGGNKYIINKFNRHHTIQARKSDGSGVAISKSNVFIIVAVFDNRTNSVDAYDTVDELASFFKELGH
ncbi:hypothetical protein CYY_005537 [Polysphondylium violaceum]|uniref:Profilin n=1 Tax=Polysphondylium violaceum TaxID=133409 RepID=A0A8J4PSR8_9MYCE|nr:hypothetical protein CYY_005537 [Polysphondylium violaceum]